MRIAFCKYCKSKTLTCGYLNPRCNFEVQIIEQRSLPRRYFLPWISNS
jgi:hypothetical protein